MGDSNSNRPRARDIGLTIGALPIGHWNAITDVPGVRVGQVTVSHGSGPLRPGLGPARTGVTVILPHDGNLFLDRVPAAYYQFNGFGKCVGIDRSTNSGCWKHDCAPSTLSSTGRRGLISPCDSRNPELASRADRESIVRECNDAGSPMGRDACKESDVLTAIESANGARWMSGRSERDGMRVRIQGRDRHGVAGDSIRGAVDGGALRAGEFWATGCLVNDGVHRPVAQDRGNRPGKRLDRMVQRPMRDDRPALRGWPGAVS